MASPAAVPTFDPSHPDARAAAPAAGAVYGSALLALIQQLAPKYGLDPRIPLAVAPHEGGFEGAVGDGGHSFGPFQLYSGGALPASVWAQGPDYAKAWANSPDGINYALRVGASAIKGATGAPGVASWVTDFERPAKQYVQGEVAKALASYGAPAPVAASIGPTSPTGPTGPAGPISPAPAAARPITQGLGIPAGAPAPRVRPISPVLKLALQILNS